VAVHREEGAYVGRLERSDECGPGMGKGDAPQDPTFRVPRPEHTIIHIASRTLGGHLNVPAGYARNPTSPRPSNSGSDVSARRVAPVGEISKITDPKQRGHLADILETLSTFSTLLGRTDCGIGIRGGIAKVMGEGRHGREPDAGARPTIGQVFGQSSEASSSPDAEGKRTS